MRDTRLRTINTVGRVTHGISDCTVIITNSPLLMHPNLSLERQKIHSYFLTDSPSEEMLPGVWAIGGIAGSKYSPTYFHPHASGLPHAAATGCLSMLPIQLGNLPPQQEVNKSADTRLPVVGWKRKSTFAFHTGSLLRARLPPLYRVWHHTFKLHSWHRASHPPPPSFCLWKLNSCIKPNIPITLAFFFVFRGALLFSFGIWAFCQARLCCNVMWVSSSPAEAIHSSLKLNENHLWMSAGLADLRTGFQTCFYH